MRILFLAIVCLLVHTVHAQKKPRKKVYFIVNDASVYVGKTHFNAQTKDITPIDLGKMLPATSLAQQLDLGAMTSVMNQKTQFLSNDYNVGLNTAMRFVKSIDTSLLYYRLVVGVGFSKSNIQNTMAVDKRPMRVDTIFGPNNELYTGVDSVAETRLYINQTNDYAYASLGISLESNPQFNLAVSLGFCFDFGVMYNARYNAVGTEGYMKYFEPVSMNNFAVGNPDERHDTQFGLLTVAKQSHVLFEESGKMKPRYVWRFSLPLGFSYRLSKIKPGLKNMRVTALLKYGGGGGSDMLETNLGLRYTFYN